MPLTCEHEETSNTRPEHTERAGHFAALVSADGFELFHLGSGIALVWPKIEFLIAGNKPLRRRSTITRSRG